MLRRCPRRARSSSKAAPTSAGSRSAQPGGDYVGDLFPAAHGPGQQLCEQEGLRLPLRRRRRGGPDGDGLRDRGRDLVRRVTVGGVHLGFVDGEQELAGILGEGLRVPVVVGVQVDEQGRVVAGSSDGGMRWRRVPMSTFIPGRRASGRSRLSMSGSRIDGFVDSIDDHDPRCCLTMLPDGVDQVRRALRSQGPGARRWPWWPGRGPCRGRKGSRTGRPANSSAARASRECEGESASRRGRPVRVGEQCRQGQQGGLAGAGAPGDHGQPVVVRAAQPRGDVLHRPDPARGSRDVEPCRRALFRCPAQPAVPPTPVPRPSVLPPPGRTPGLGRTAVLP